MTKDDVRGTAIGYAVNLVMDYGNGRQATISGTLPLGATLGAMNEELDKLRLATNRQSAFVMLRDVENTVMLAKKTSASLELMVEEYAKELEVEIERLGTGERSKHTLVKTQIDNMRSQAAGYRATKREEIMRAQADLETGEMLIAKLKKEIGEG